MKPKPIVVIESPFAGDVPRNIAYVRACIQDSLGRGEAPVASHLLYTQPGVLDDDKPEERKLGMEAGWEFMRVASRVVFYTDLGMSEGMQAAMRRAEALGVPTEERKGIQSWDTHDQPFPPPQDPEEGADEYRERLARSLVIRWSMRSPVIVREAMLALAQEIERGDLD
jgi:hypothetical protein